MKPIRLNKFIYSAMRLPAETRGQLDHDTVRYVTAPMEQRISFSPEVKTIPGMVAWGLIKLSIDDLPLFMASLLAAALLPFLAIRHFI